jgi:lipoprotein-anchoring transpeptidase ErfK/SrfK
MRVFRAFSLAVMTAVIALFCSAAAGGPTSPVTPVRAAAPAPLAAPALVAAPARAVAPAPAVVAPAVAAPAPAAAAPAPAPAAAPASAPAAAPPPAPAAAPAAPVVAPEKAPARPAAPTVVPGTPCASTARACVDLSANQAWLISGGAVSYGPVPITSGRKGFRTPPGTFRVTFKNRDHVSSIYDAPMPYSVFFNGGIAFHQGSLREKSHGCIHLSRAAAKSFFGALGRGDVVQVVR